MAKIKNLKKKIRRLEARLQKGAKKLAKLKRKLEETGRVAVFKTEAKSGAVAKKGGETPGVPAPIQKKKRPFASKGEIGPVAAVKEARVAAKKKRKLNLTPERRAQLAEAMRARWAAKRAASVGTAQDRSSSPGSSLGDSSQP
jgi:cell division septum initiation protein DivIVA